MPNYEQILQIKQGKGFIAALDQSGGSTPKALGLYGVDESYYTNEDQMYNLIHAMRARIATTPTFTGDNVIGAILFEMTMNREINGMPSAKYLWEKRKVVPFLKIDNGLEPKLNGVQIMKKIENLDTKLEHAVSCGIFGTKMRSVIHQASKSGISTVVAQQFEVSEQISSHGLIPIIEPEITILISDKVAAENILEKELLACLNELPSDRQIILKLTLPDIAGTYSNLVKHPRVMRTVALSGGYNQGRANEELSKNEGIIASFSRALTEGLSIKHSDKEFNEIIKQSISSIAYASSN
tara:strand:- start:657 stop:1547 length:891 start_codon:yes stop_codon:yes gene_type:complete